MGLGSVLDRALWSGVAPLSAPGLGGSVATQLSGEVSPHYGGLLCHWPLQGICLIFKFSKAPVALSRYSAVDRGSRLENILTGHLCHRDYGRVGTAKAWAAHSGDEAPPFPSWSCPGPTAPFPWTIARPLRKASQGLHMSAFPADFQGGPHRPAPPGRCLQGVSCPSSQLLF